MSQGRYTLGVQSILPEGHVAPLLPATAPVPELAHRISLFKGLLFFWLFPNRYGPHLATDSGWRAWAAHAMAVTFAGSMIGLALLITEFGLGFSLHGLRIMAAERIIALALESTSRRWSWWPMIGAILALPLAELILMVLAVVVMPWCAGGDRAASVFRRSLKNVYWSTTGLIPISIVFIPAVVCESLLEAWAKGADRWIEALLYLVLLTVFVVLPAGLFLRMLLVGAGRYVGPPDGPAFAPREPRCDDCGYLIIGLPLETNCPECGLPVRESLPGGRRRPTPWQQHEFRPRGFHKLLRAQWHVLGGKDFFRRLPVHAGWTAARHFWWVTFLLIELASLAVLLLLSAISQNVMDLSQVGMVVAVPFMLQAAMMFVGCLWAQFRCEIRDYRVSAIVCYYAAPLMWPFVVVLWLAMICTTSPFSAASADLQAWVLNYLARHGITPAGVRLSGLELTIGFLVLLGVASLLLWWLRLRQALRAVRYANV